MHHAPRTTHHAPHPCSPLVAPWRNAIFIIHNIIIIIFRSLTSPEVEDDGQNVGL
jgi:hypothetical protein